MRPYSNDLRERILLDSDAGMSPAQVGQKYHVSAATVKRLKRLRQETGQIEPKKIGGYRKSPLEDRREDIERRAFTSGAMFATEWWPAMLIISPSEASAGKAIIHYLSPVKMVSAFCQRNWPEVYHDVAKGVKVPKAAKKAKASTAALTFEEVLDFLEWLKSYPLAEVLIPGVMLQGLCALQLQEALRLRMEDVDFGKGIITIHRQLKNEYRRRDLPLPRLVLERLRQLPPEEEMAVPGGYRDRWVAYSHLLKRALTKWRKDCPIAPKDFRKTFQSHAMLNATAEWKPYLVARFMGHAPRTIGEKHYTESRPEELAKHFREQITPAIDRLVENFYAGRTKGENALGLHYKEKGAGLADPSILAAT